MAFFLAIAAGMSSYYWLFEYFHITDDMASTVGWIVGILVCILSNVIEIGFKRHHARIEKDIKENKKILNQINQHHNKEYQNQEKELNT